MWEFCLLLQVPKQIMKKRVVSILLLLLLLAPVAATWCWLQYQKSAVKRELKWKLADGIDRSELVLLKFSRQEAETNLRWEHAREFEYKGEMYDIVETLNSADSVYYWCWWDHEETALNKQLAALVTKSLGDNPEKKEKQQQLLSYLKLHFCVPESSEQLHTTEAKPARHSRYILAYDPVELLPVYPPPKLG